MTLRATLRSSNGFTYIAALALVVIVGILAAQTATFWKLRMQREKETELIFRGTQIRDAMRRYYGMPLTANGLVTPPGATAPTTTVAPTDIPAGAPQLNELKELLQDPKSAGKSRSLRKLYLDPMIGKDEPLAGKGSSSAGKGNPMSGDDRWFLERNANQKIIGVSSFSDAEPIKQGNFPLDLEPADFEGKKKYSEWKFLVGRYPKPAPDGGVKGLDKSTSGTSSGGTGTPSSTTK
jgi:type II secretory pathway pseudopilin PulG